MPQDESQEKIQRRHRPLGPDQFRQKYLRHRFDDLEAEVEAARLLGYGGVEIDECWNPMNPRYHCVYCGSPECGDYIPFEKNDLQCYRVFEIQQFVRSLVQSAPPLFKTEWASDAHVPSSTRSEVEPTLGPSDERIEQRLASHIRGIILGDPFVDVEGSIHASVVSFRNIEIIKQATRELRCSNLAERICLFAPFWIRSPETWEKSGDTTLLEHLFVRYEAPKFLESGWHISEDSVAGWDRPTSYFKWACWFILLGQGGSLRRAMREGFDWNISRKFQHCLSRIPEDACVLEGSLLAEILRLGGSSLEFNRVLAHPALVYDPTDRLESALQARFWRASILWLVENREALSDEDAHLILDWAIHEMTESFLRGRSFSWQGITVQAALQQSREYRRQREDRIFSYSYRWSGHDWDWQMEEAGSAWAFVELTTGEKLFEEGKSLRHCVASYAGRCAAGFSAIVSMRRNGNRQITVEVDPRTKQIVQARGLGNRLPSSDEQRIIRLWRQSVLANSETRE